MPALKQLSTHQARTTIQSNLTNISDNIISNTVAALRVRMLSQNKKVQDYQRNDRLSYQQTNKLSKVANKIKRRISTAGTSKRFPKDFFRVEFRENGWEKQPCLMLKYGKTLTQYNQRIPLQAKKKLYNMNIQLHEIDHNLIKTPKFHDPQKQLQSQTQNQFIQNNQNKIVTPFPKIQQLKIDAIEEKPNNYRPSFIKKVKKCQFLRSKIQSNRIISQCRQFSVDLQKIKSIH